MQGHINMISTWCLSSPRQGIFKIHVTLSWPFQGQDSLTQADSNLFLMREDEGNCGSNH